MTSMTPSTDRPARAGLAIKLFAILILLGAVAVLVTGVLGYMRARDALQQSIYNQLTATRKSKARQIETYFRTIRNELSQLAVSKMAIDAARGFNAGFDELDRADVPFDIRRQVGDWYEEQFLPDMRRILGKKPNVNDYLPVGPAAYYLQYHYIVTNPYPAAQRKLLDDAGDGSAYSAQHAIYHPLLRAAAASFGFFDFMLANPKSGRIVYGVDKEVDLGASLRTGSYRQSNLAAAVARCGVTPDRSAVCLEDFAPYAPSGGAPIAFMAAPVIDQGSVIGVLVAQLSIDEIDNVVTGDRRWRQDGFGATGEAYLVGPDHFARSGPRAFYEANDVYFAELKGGGEADEDIDAIRRYGTPVLHQRIDTAATRAASAGAEGTGEILGYRHIPILASWGPLAIPGLKWVLVVKIDTSEAFAPIYKLQRDLMIVGGLALLVVIVTGAWLSRSLLGPLRELTAGVTRFAAGDYGAKVPVRTRDEIGALCTAFNGMVEELHGKNIEIESKNRENEELLLNVLPAPIANRLRGGEQGIADGFAEVTVAFADIVGFTAMSSEMPPADVVSTAERPVHPLRRCRPRARHREDQDRGRRLHGGVRHAGAGARPCRAHGAHGHPHGPHHARARDGAPCRDEAPHRHQQRAGGGGRDRQEQVHLRSVGRHGEPGEPHGIGRHARRHPGDALGLRQAEGQVRLRIARRDRGQGQRRRRGLAAEALSHVLPERSGKELDRDIATRSDRVNHVIAGGVPLQWRVMVFRTASVPLAQNHERAGRSRSE